MMRLDDDYREIRSDHNLENKGRPIILIKDLVLDKNLTLKAGENGVYKSSVFGYDRIWFENFWRIVRLFNKEYSTFWKFNDKDKLLNES
jgi:hypothetical protein